MFSFSFLVFAQLVMIAIFVYLFIVCLLKESNSLRGTESYWFHSILLSLASVIVSRIELVAFDMYLLGELEKVLSLCSHRLLLQETNQEDT